VYKQNLDLNNKDLDLQQQTGATTTKPKGDTTIGPIPATAAGLVAVSPFVVPGKRGNVPDTSPREGEPGSASNPIYVATLKVTPLNPRTLQRQ
jgi:hypothetical protein